MKVKTLYLGLCIVGLILPYWELVPWVRANGLHLALLFQQLFANRIAAFFAMDVIVLDCLVDLCPRGSRPPEGNARKMAATAGGVDGWGLTGAAAFPLSARTGAGRERPNGGSEDLIHRRTALAEEHAAETARRNLAPAAKRIGPPGRKYKEANSCSKTSISGRRTPVWASR